MCEQGPGEKALTIKTKRFEPAVVRILQPGRIPPRPEWMEGEAGYVQSVSKSCPKCRSNDVWRGLWCHFAERHFILVRMEPSVKHSGRARHCACRDCGEFWSDVQAIPYTQQEGVA